MITYFHFHTFRFRYTMYNVIPEANDIFLHFEVIFF